MTLQSPQGPRTPIAPSFVGHIVAFTGKLASVGRREASALVKCLGGVAVQEVTARTTMLVVGVESAVEKSNKLRKAEDINARSPGAVTIVTEEEFCRLGGLRSNESLKRLYHGFRQIRELYPLVREDRLRHLQKWGLIRPVVRTNADTYYSFRDVAVVKRIDDELEQGVPFRRAVRAMLAEQDGQLALDFEAARGDAQQAKVITLRQLKTDRQGNSMGESENQAGLAARFFLEGSELDEGPEADPERACVAYRKALLLDPTLVPALVNLANIHYAQDQLVEAQALYERALALDGECFEAFFNLGNIHHDLGRYGTAVAYYQDALRMHDTYADAHFYLAVTFEKLGQSSDAKPHWSSYQRLAPDGEWVDLAREFSE